MSSKLQVFFVIFTLQLLGSTAVAQIAIGINEAALGNSGVAITESTAPSYYNPALLSEKQKNNFSLNGTSLTNFKSSTAAGDFNSTKIAPNYISSINAFDTFVHEFSLINQFSLDSKLATTTADTTRFTHLKLEQYNLAYTFAFKNFPFGFQLGLRINEQDVSVDAIEDNINYTMGASVDYSQKVGYAYAGIGGIHQFTNNYRFGYKYETDGLKIYKKEIQTGKFYVFDKNNSTFSKGDTTDSSVESTLNSQIITIGHSFSLGAHEFLTDSRFTEQTDSRGKFDFIQTFGYKIKFDNKMQFMCGIAREFETKSNYISSGFSWPTNTLRSTLSAYHVKGDTDFEAAGISLGSQFAY